MTLAPGGWIYVARCTLKLGDGDQAVAVSNDVAACDLRGLGIAVLKFSSVIHFATKFADSSACSEGVEETDQAGELAQLRDERLVDVANDLVRAGQVDTVVTDEWWRACDAPSVVLQGRALEWAHRGVKARGHSRRGRC